MKTKAFPLLNYVWNKVTLHRPITNSIFKFNYVSKLFVEKELKQLKVNKATGLDNLPARMIRDTASVISKPLTHIINLSLVNSEIPTDWKMSKITPLHKNGKTTTAGNYRPVSVLSIFSKVLERAVQTQLVGYLEKNHLLYNKQFGFRKKRSTELASALFIDEIRKEIDKGKLVGVIFIDLSKAFDTLSHSILLSKLSSFGINGTELKWFTGYLFNRSQICSYDGVLSDPYPLTTGVPQGSILGPLLFLLYFNDFVKCLENASTIQFADDTVVYVSDKEFYVIENKLNTELKSISNYFSKNELIINLNKGKTESMIFGTTKKLSKLSDGLNLKYDETSINQTKLYKYLGTRIDPTLNMNEHFNHLYKQSSSKLSILSALRDRLTKESIYKIYSGMILPCLLFNCINNLNLNNTQKAKLKSIQRHVECVTGRNVHDISKQMEYHSVKLFKKCLYGLV